MASLSSLLCLLGLLLCVAASHRLSTSPPSKAKKPIIGKKEGRAPASLLGASSQRLRSGKHLGKVVRGVLARTAQEARRDTVWVLLKRREGGGSSEAPCGGFLFFVHSEGFLLIKQIMCMHYIH